MGYMSPIIALAIFMGVASAALQLSRVLRGHSSGVSLLGWSLIAAVNLSWAAYFFFIVENNIIAAFDVLFAAGSVAIVVSAANRQGVRHHGYTAMTLAIATAITITVAISPVVGGVAVGVLSTSMFVPQAWTAVTRLARQQTLDGVSLATWMWNVLGAVLWMGVGISLDQMPAIISNATLAGLAGVITLSVFLSRQQNNAVEVTGPRLNARRVSADK